ncbi:hypothetical protein MMC27_007133 [Xylographa pallens]|nr:hypothetical protein [Xylographa pallens]
MANSARRWWDIERLGMPSMWWFEAQRTSNSGDEVGGVDEPEAIWFALPSRSRSDMSPTPIGVILKADRQPLEVVWNVVPAGLQSLTRRGRQ